ncbi:hypothetical protein KM1_154900 [Entamoeba histolytica HM-3:IMSS]|uniref:TLDc domain-containing protein n=1 Tax=Entamoeba histolytica HM-3:IMSS TaxID=885315 RepID=M7W2T5_ENTHI|nr:hypothetical protein KM1_154900 [Entamoeba histolytica HM-3:IMSS]
MMKFDINIPRYAFYLYSQSDDRLFGFGYGYGHDIFVYKENNKTESYCKQSYEYKGISNPLCGKQYPEHFTPQRIIIIEMK